MNTYDKIEDVLKKAAKPLTEFEFVEIAVPVKEWPHHEINGRMYVGCTESTLGRRLREMRELGRVKAQRREGKTFVEYALVPKSEQADFLPETVAA